ncbi:phytanoyl-CoA dioxygenase family protein [Enhygromyxa salina]|uniref:Proansamycin X synthase n=1 Tax=Enhygromyxa salina TaxID=215803 RepID=A0A2S9YR59_9BACT|nr:phytanoyl-CoA dioxygenase family protein [Enhygromyxa salina]PRQ07549.1 Proansamycin X synthase [Enhygromyxa salina]
MTSVHGLDRWLDHADIEAFHARLGLPRETPSKRALTALVARTLERVPFQNICMLARPRRAPTLAEVRADMLEGLGGPCGHMNPFFAALLYELGYAVTLVAGSMQAPDCHIALIIALDGEQLWVDIGNGFPYLEPIPLGDPRRRHHPMLDHRLRPLGGARWQVQHRRRGQLEWSRNYDFDLTPRTFASFAGMIDAHYSRPGYGPFLSGLRVNRHLPDRSIVLRDRVLRVIAPDRDDVHSLDDIELALALRDHFPTAELPLNDALEHLQMPLEAPPYEVETRSFKRLDDHAHAFLREHGYVVLAPMFDAALLTETLDSWRALKLRCAEQMGLEPTRYDAHVSQWRDLWRHEPAFAELLGDARLWGTASAGLGLTSARLLHDHVIAKPRPGLNGTIPWHQDATFWPVDRSGLSCWLPFVDVGPTGGCLEVIDGSHRWGPGAPADFIATPRSQFPADASVIRLPAKAGSIVVLDGLTWHRSRPNEDHGERPVYISLWMPPNTRYVPHHAAWHPVNEHVTVEPGAVLDGEWFPCFGSRSSSEDALPRLDHAGPDLSEPLTMFEASRLIAGQIGRLLDEPGVPLAIALADSERRAAVRARALAVGLLAPARADELGEILEQLWISAEAFRLHRARNVYNAAYVAWWDLVGRTLWESEQQGATCSSR